MPKIEPDFSGPGVAGLTSTANLLAAWMLVSCVIVIILGFLIAALGPRFGFHGAKALGIGGIMAGLLGGAVLSMATTSVNTIGGWF